MRFQLVWGFKVGCPLLLLLGDTIHLHESLGCQTAVVQAFLEAALLQQLTVWELPALAPRVHVREKSSLQ